MQERCTRCKRIVSAEAELDERSQVLVGRVKAETRQARERNNLCWKAFWLFCNIPLLGRLIFTIFNRSPRWFMRSTDYYGFRKKEWYCSVARGIHEGAYELEKLKYEHLEHWGQEQVTPMFYSPLTWARAKCYEAGSAPRLPKKYMFLDPHFDFEKFEDEDLVMCERTLRLFPLSQCRQWEFDLTTGRVFYKAPGIL